MQQEKKQFIESMENSIGQIIRLSMRSFRLFIKNQGLSMPQMMALQRIHFKASCNIAEISDELGVTDAATSQMLDRLVQQGLVIRTENPQDRRNKQLELTERGQLLVKESFHARQKWLTSIADQLTPEEMGQVTITMNILTQKTIQMQEE
jgi:DNA-binding MarR family transcriptional regulator